MARFRLNSILECFRWLGNIRLEAFVAGAIVAYFSGWHYVNSYFDSFDINRSSFSFDNYTVILYSFFVLVELPNILISFTSISLIGVGTFFSALLVSAAELKDDVCNSMNILRRIVALGFGISSVFCFSTEAGRSDAHQVIEDNRGRRVEVVVTEHFREALEAQYGKDHAGTRMKEILDANDCGGLALIWRNNHETMVLLYETTSGEGHGDPLVTYRIPDRFIALVESKPRQNGEPEEC